MLAVVQVLVVEGGFATVLTVDIDICLGHLCGDGGIAASTNVDEHLIGAGTLDRDGVEEVAQHTEGLVTDNEFLGATRHVEPDLTGMLFGGNYT